ncbi:MAG TPA: hypothetical protein P5186_16015 [Candidatus Paceibacterota bacterium]|nr:hypothetical protein [Verrucomicrobiota bacterium]HRY49555.1 hypothetical protein [Candidatus Paceibacterota bacterium]HSA03814.1 hypothetical protein [Candidatus Paceibacterota bacterium]
MDWIQRHSSVFNSTSCKLRFLDIQVRRTGTAEHLAFFAFPFTILPAWQDGAGSGSPVRLAALMQHIELGG